MHMNPAGDVVLKFELREKGINDSVIEATLSEKADKYDEYEVAFNMAKELDEVENFKQKYEKYRTDLEKIDNLFVDSKNPVEFIKFLENTASDAGVRLEISSPSFSSDAKFPLMIFRLSSYGDFSKNLSFIKKLEAGPYLAKIQNLDIGRYQDGQSSKDKKQSEKIKSVFSINVFAK